MWWSPPTSRRRPAPRWCRPPTGSATGSCGMVSRAADGTWTWTPLTADSTIDNLRPEITDGSARRLGAPLAARQLHDLPRPTTSTWSAWSRGRTAAGDRPDRPRGPRSSTCSRPDALDPTPARPVVGQLDGHPADDVFMAPAGSAPRTCSSATSSATPPRSRRPPVHERGRPGRRRLRRQRPHGHPLVRARARPRQPLAHDRASPRSPRHPSRQVHRHLHPHPRRLRRRRPHRHLLVRPRHGHRLALDAPPRRHLHHRNPARQVSGTYTPIPGDYDGDGRTDIFWYAPGTATDHLWTATAAGTFTTTTPHAGQRHLHAHPRRLRRRRPHRHLLVRARRRHRPALDRHPAGTFTTTTPQQVNGTYTPIPGDFDGDGRTDIHWYAPTGPRLTCGGPSRGAAGRTASRPPSTPERARRPRHPS